VLVDSSSCFTSAGPRDGALPKISAAAPATCGAAIDVPAPTAVAVLEAGLADRISTPGAKMSLLSPQLENDATPSVGVVAATVIAASTRAGLSLQVSIPSLPAATDVYELLKSELTDIPHEEFWILLLNRANRVIKKTQISQGGVSGTVADPKIIFKVALEELASGVILAHNHPSGNLSASQADMDLTRKLKEAGKLLEIQVLDHLIVGGLKYFSFADEGLL
jgi:DNA repair protein RadC